MTDLGLEELRIVADAIEKLNEYHKGEWRLDDSRSYEGEPKTFEGRLRVGTGVYEITKYNSGDVSPNEIECCLVFRVTNGNTNTIQWARSYGSGFDALYVVEALREFYRRLGAVEAKVSSGLEGRCHKYDRDLEFLLKPSEDRR